MKKIIKHKYACLLFFLLLLSCPFPVHSERRSITLNLSKVPLDTALKEIERQTSMSVVYNTNDIEIDRIISIKVTDESLDHVMNRLFREDNISFSIVKDHIVLSPAKSVKEDQQQKKTPVTASGSVTDANGEPLIGVSILVKGTSNGTVTDMDGHFKIQAAKGDMLEVSYIGYAPQAVTVTDARPMKIVLTEDTQVLDEVVVTALGIKRATKALSYNVQEVKGDELTAVKDANFMNSLVGKVAGVQINTGANGAGGASRVILRGMKSLTKDDNALYVIDGIPMFNINSGNSGGSTMGHQPGSSSIADINPEDIESMTVLTGPAAAALYGSDAANGVVMITTKKGAEGGLKVTYNNSTNFSTPLIMPRFQNTYGNVKGNSMSWGNRLDKPTSFSPKDFFNTGVTEINSLTFTTGNEKNQLYASASATNSTGLLPNSKYNRYNFSIRNTTRFAKDKLTLDLGAQHIVQDNLNMVGSGSYFNPLSSLYLFPRGENFEEVQMFERWSDARNLSEQYWPASIYSTDQDMQNPYWIMHRMLHNTNRQRYMYNVSLSWNITDGISLTGRIKKDNTNQESSRKYYASTRAPFNGGSSKGFYETGRQNDSSFYADILLHINKTAVKDRLSIDANIGASVNDIRESGLHINGGLSKVPNFFHLGNIDLSIAKKNETKWHDQTQSVFGSVELGWDHWLYLTATGRNDWASQLAFTHKTSYFYPSVGLSVVFNELFQLPEAISMLKLRGSWAEVASAPERYMTQMQYNYDEGRDEYVYPTEHYTDELRPENTRSWEVGLNAKFFHNSLYLDATLYRSNTFNQVLRVDASSSSGYEKNIVQAGNIQNEGIEFSIGYEKKWKKFGFSTGFTYTLNKNKIVRLANGAIDPITGEEISMDYYSMGTLGLGGGPEIRLTEGGTMGDLYINEYLRETSNGYVWRDEATGGIKIDEKSGEYRKIGSTLPKYQLSWRGLLSWSGLSLNWTFAARVGGLVVSDTQAMLDRYGVSETTVAARDMGGVTLPDGTLIDAYEYYKETTAHMGLYYTYDATNIRLADLSLSYNMPKRWFGNKIDMTLSLTGKNLWMIYCKAPFDPESTSAVSNNFYQGVDYFQMPSLKGLGFNLKVSF